MSCTAALVPLSHFVITVSKLFRQSKRIHFVTFLESNEIYDDTWYDVKRLAQLVEHRTAVREVAGSNLDRTNTQGLKISATFVMTSANG